MKLQYLFAYKLIEKINANVPDGEWCEWGQWFIRSYVGDLIENNIDDPLPKLTALCDDPETTRKLHLLVHKEIKSLHYHIQAVKSDLIDFDVTNTGLLLWLK